MKGDEFLSKYKTEEHFNTSETDCITEYQIYQQNIKNDVSYEQNKCILTIRGNQISLK